MPATPRGRRTRDLILERTAEVFDRNGFAGSTLTNLVEATGLTRGAFYFHFESKDQLAEALINEQRERWLPVIDELEADEPDPMRRLIRLTYRSGSLFQGDVVMRAGSRLATERASMQRAVWRTYPWWISTVQRLLHEAVQDLSDLETLASETWPDRELVSPGVPRGIAALAEHLVGAWAGIQQQAIAQGGGDLPDRVRASWLVTLPWLCTRTERCAELTQLVEELTTAMRAAGAGGRRTPDDS